MLFLNELASDSAASGAGPLRIAFAGLLTSRGRVCRFSPSVFAPSRASDSSRWPQPCCWPALATAAPDPDRIAVNVDQAKLVKLPGGIATIVVGNPLIADVTLQNGGVVVVTGKGYGATNFIALDRTGQVLVDRQIQVEGPSDQLVTALSRHRSRNL